MGRLAEEFSKIESCYNGFFSQSELIDCTKEANALDMICLNFMKAFDHIFPDILVHTSEFIVDSPSLPMEH